LQQSWSDNPGKRETRPMNCVSWYEAYAFCAWDGGRLPTEAEWEWVAAGGSQNLLYVWGAHPRTADSALFNAEDLAPVGSMPQDETVSGHRDLAGSVSEWVFDAWDAEWYSGAGNTCVDCANLSGDLRVRRGSAWNGDNETFLRVTFRNSYISPRDRRPGTGVRCARNDR
jgi:formylglycine-generating enzyme required for sulfatase activity